MKKYLTTRNLMIVALWILGSVALVWLIPDQNTRLMVDAVFALILAFLVLAMNQGEPKER